MSLIGSGFIVNGSVFVHVTPAVDRKELRLLMTSVALTLRFQVHSCIDVHLKTLPCSYLSRFGVRNDPFDPLSARLCLFGLTKAEHKCYSVKEM